MKDKDYLVAKELKKKLSSHMKLVDFRIFGSRAKDTYEEDSDMDIFIEVEDLTKKVKREISEIVWEVGFNHFITISPLVFTRDEVENSALRASPVIHNIFADGILV